MPERQEVKLGEGRRKSVRVGLADMRVDFDYQAPLIWHRVQDMVQHWRPELLQPVVVNRRGPEDDVVWIMDGQHRHAAAERVLGKDADLDAILYEGLTVSEEAALYFELNTAVRKKTMRAIFKARLRSGEQTATSIARIAEECGLWVNVDNHPSARSGRPLETGLVAVKSLDEMYRLGGPEHLRDVLSTMSQAWPRRERGTAMEFLLGLHILLAAHGDDLDRRSLGDKLREQDPRDLIGSARGLAKGDPQTRTHKGFSTYLVLVDLYNRNRRVRLLKPLGTPADFRRIRQRLQRGASLAIARERDVV